MNTRNELTSESDWDSSWEAFEPEAIKDYLQKIIVEFIVI
jgi:hypothetical protein